MYSHQFAAGGQLELALNRSIAAVQPIFSLEYVQLHAKFLIFVRVDFGDRESYQTTLNYISEFDVPARLVCRNSRGC